MNVDVARSKADCPLEVCPVCYLFGCRDEVGHIKVGVKHCFEPERYYSMVSMLG